MAVLAGAMPAYSSGDATERVLRHQIAVLIKQKKALTARNAKLIASNRKIFGALQDAQAEIASVRGALHQTQANLEMTQQERDALRSRLDALGMPEFQRAVQVVREEATVIDRLPPVSGKNMPHGYVVSMAAMNYVNGHVLAAEYSYRVQFGEPLPATSEQVLETQAGICGEASAVFAEIVNALGLPVRRVAFYPTDPGLGHTAAETYYDSAWHYFDPTWGAVYGAGPGDAVSITDARARQLRPTRDNTLIWGMGKPSLSELTDPATRVEFDNPPF